MSDPTPPLPDLAAARTVLHDTFGYQDFRGPQAAVVEAVLAGRDCLVLMPTGGGKSLCYQIPALVRPGTALVVSPLIALMQDQVAALAQLGVRAAYLNSSLTPAQQAEVMADLRAGHLDLLYVAPERLLLPDTLALLGSIPLSLIAIDEAHCVSQWGHDFRADYLGLDVLAEQFPGVPRMALTATAEPVTREEIVRNLALVDPARFVAGFDRPNIRYRVQPRSDEKKQLAAFLTEHSGAAGIVYCMSRAKVEKTAEWLCNQGHTAVPYHAGMPGHLRSRNQQRFLNEDGVIVCATIAFGMGIDKPDVRFVAHLDLPKSVEGYYQETGRAGRDGAPAEAFMVYGLQDVVRLRQMVDGGEASEERKRVERQKLDALLGWCELTTCRRQALLAYFGDNLPEPCGNCDTCLEPPKLFDATVAAQKLLSCVYRTGMRFGVAHLIDVLLGKDTDKVRQHHHNEVSTWGIGSEYSQAQWRAIARQLLALGYLHADQSRYGALVFTDKSRPVLKGAETLHLREDVVQAARSSGRKAKAKTAAPASADLDDQARNLFEHLRGVRRTLAEEQGVPPYVIFHDATLAAMAVSRPTNTDGLLALSGVGQAKADKFGATFLAAVANHGLDQSAGGPAHD